MDGDFEDEPTGSTGKQVIARAAAVLRMLASQSEGASIGQIAKATNLPRTTVHRIVTALETQGLAATSAAGVRLGPSLARLAASAHRDISMLARPSIESLARRTRETVDLCIQRGAHAVSIAQYPSDQALRVVCSVGTAFPLHSTAHGKALLSRYNEAELRTLFSVKPERRTEATVVDIDELLKQLEVVRREGFAVEFEEHAEGICGLGVYLDLGQPEHHALTLAVPAVRFNRRREELQAALLQCKAEIEFAART